MEITKGTARIDDGVRRSHRRISFGLSPVRVLAPLWGAGLTALLVLAGCPGPSGDDDGTTGAPVETPPDEGEVPESPTPPPTPGVGSPEPTVAPDSDEDGFGAADDCDDTDPAVHPGGIEQCNGKDDDCDGDVDEDPIGAPTWYADQDGDGYGDPSNGMAACAQPEGTVDNGDDCDDTDPALNPETTWYLDRDQDGYGTSDVAAVQCEAPSDDFVLTVGDCNDQDAAYHPGAAEPDCDDPNDYDCDGQVGYTDGDSDGYPACGPDGVRDCDDENSDVHPGADEVCDGIDNDCDEGVTGGEGVSPGGIDEEAVDAPIWYADQDGDGYGDPSSGVTACTQPEDSVDNGDDCDDTDPALNPETVWYVDADGDGYGDTALSLEQCEPPGDYYTPLSGDCLDSDSAYHPGAPEDDCTDPNDYNCDGQVGFVDQDGDGYAACGENADCNDTDPDVHPGAAEVCNEKDDDCDGLSDGADPDATDLPTWYIDYDGDGFGTPRYTDVGCEAPGGYVDNADDCDDTDPAVHPGAAEVCNGKDDDCDEGTSGGGIDEGAVDAPAWHLDADGDGYGSETDTLVACELPQGYLSDGSDCDDGDPEVFPGAVEVCNGKDDDCDGNADAGGAGLDRECAAATCQAVLDEQPDAEDGDYWIDPLGTGDPFLVHCDMTHADGGWTLVATLSNVDGVRHWSETDPIFSAWQDNESLIADVPDLSRDYKSRAFGELPAQALLIVTDKDIWGVWSGLNGLSLMDRIATEADGCKSWSDTEATLPVASASTGTLSRNIIINAVDGNASGHCPFGNSGDYASDSAVLGFTGTKDYGVENGDGLQGVGQSWETNIKNTRAPAVHCTAIDCWEDFVSAYGWEQSGNDNLFIATVFNNGIPDLEPDVIWLYTR